MIGVRRSFYTGVADGSHLFQTDATGLFELYLAALPGHRQQHNCTACRRFIERFGALVTIRENGETDPVMWSKPPDDSFYMGAFAELCRRVRKAKVIAPFYAKEKEWGQGVTGNWTHMSVNPPERLIYRIRALSPGQAMAAAMENHKTVLTALAEFKSDALKQALKLLRAEALQRSDKFTGPVQWLLDLHERPKGRLGNNVLWREIASAPAGYCHPKASVVGSLLEDIAAGLDFSTIKGRFNAKLGPLQYQRPQAAPKAGNVAAAERLVEKLGLQRSLERRFARFEEVAHASIWRPKPVLAIRPKAASPGVFGNVKARGKTSTVPSVALPNQTLTWEKFARVVLPLAQRLELDAPSFGRYIALTTAVDRKAPPIFKWDHEDERNPVSWYVYPNGSPASQWRLKSGWNDVAVVVPFPTCWGSRPMPQEAEGVILIIKGAADTVSGGAGLFPGLLKSHLHSASSTLEAFSQGAKVSGRETASACGYDIRKGKGHATARLRAWIDGEPVNVTIDRWD